MNYYSFNNKLHWSIHMYSRQFTQYILGFVFLVFSSFSHSLILTLDYDGASEVRITGQPWNWDSYGAETTMDASGNWFVNIETPDDEVAYNWIVGGETEFLIDNIKNMECQQDLADVRIISDLENYAVRIWRPGYIEVIDSYDACSDSNQNNGLSYFIVSDDDVRVNGCANSLDCPSNIVIPDTYSNRQLTSILEGGFSGSQISSVEVPGTIYSIPENAFSESAVNQVMLNKGISEIREYAFYGTQLTGLNFPETLIYIGSNSFSFSNINSIHFEGNRPDIEYDAFEGNDLGTVTYCSGATGWPGVSIDGVIPEPVHTCANSNVIYATFDIDQNGSVGALSDGLILLRYFFGLRGEGLIADVLADDATRTSAGDIEAYIESHMP